ncbi:alpha/beta fold hydrolase [Streptomyces sp. NPDC050617]|uniref:alpha/beta fold hydrolase n=1 Tax=Streptomyces sp. NPDC050617 TaxID=3154628 RepID=UPI00341D4EEA
MRSSRKTDQAQRRPIEERLAYIRIACIELTGIQYAATPMPWFLPWFPGAELTVTAQRYGGIPHSYVVCGRDNVVPAALQRRIIKEIDAVSATPAAVTELDCSHSPFLSQPAALADAIAAAPAAD